MKQKIIIKVHVRCDKCRSKAMQVAAVEDGVNSVALEGEDKDKVVVIGDRVDAANLTSRLHKKLGYAWLESVEEVKPPVKDEEKKPTADKNPTPAPAPTPCASSCNCGNSQCQLLFAVCPDPNPTDSCIIM